MNKKPIKKQTDKKVEFPKTKLPKPIKRGPTGKSAQKGALGATSGY